MKYERPLKVVITGGHEIGGLSSFAEALRIGFTSLGVSVEVISPRGIFLRWRDLRDPRVLKILSTTALFSAPIARRSICMIHGIPRLDDQGWLRLLGIISAQKFAAFWPGVQMVAVSHYIAITLRVLFGIKADAVIHNPAKSIYFEKDRGPEPQRRYITYVGRLIPAKNLHRILPALRDLLDEVPGLRVCVIGEGPQRSELEALVAGDDRFEFRGAPDDATVRDLLRQTRMFFSGNEVEGFGITYLEALSQGCTVAMPGSGGGLEIAFDKVGKSVHLFPLSWERGGVIGTLRRALKSIWEPISTSSFTVDAVAASYLDVDARFFQTGFIHKSRSTPRGTPLLSVSGTPPPRTRLNPPLPADGNEGNESAALP